MSWSHL